MYVTEGRKMPGESSTLSSSTRKSSSVPLILMLHLQLNLRGDLPNRLSPEPIEPTFTHAPAADFT
jgi:hypothetical protein